MLYPVEEISEGHGGKRKNIMGKLSRKRTIIVLLFAVLLLATQACGAGKKTKEPLGPDASTIDKLWHGFVSDVTQ
ncbi:hypothetical protein MYX64_05940 [Nitrospinae bacterium AH_259_B05_G02_I21]|nr:hypothetical protein [Nitrospinae bacterium AH_259_B05_G02_I21]